MNIAVSEYCGLCFRLWSALIALPWDHQPIPHHWISGDNNNSVRASLQFHCDLINQIGPRLVSRSFLFCCTPNKAAVWSLWFISSNSNLTTCVIVYLHHYNSRQHWGKRMCAIKRHNSDILNQTPTFVWLVLPVFPFGFFRRVVATCSASSQAWLN